MAIGGLCCDVAFHKLNWQSKIPVEFKLSNEYYSNTEKPLPYYMMVNRSTYFTLVLAPVINYFSLYIKSFNIDEVWLEYLSEPLKWHHPVGVLFDLEALDGGTIPNLPWKIFINFQNFPKKRIPILPNKEYVESIFMSTLKEADYLKHKSVVINGLTKKEHKLLWSSFFEANFDEYFEIWQKFFDSKLETNHIPFKIFINKQTIPYQEVFNLTDKTLNIGDMIKKTLFLDENQYTLTIQNINIPMITPLLWLSNNLCYPDNFLYIFLNKK